MIKIYGKDNCTHCVSMKRMLEEKNMEFTYLEDLKTLMMVASKARIMSAPVIEYEEEFYSMPDFINNILGEL